MRAEHKIVASNSCPGSWARIKAIISGYGEARWRSFWGAAILLLLITAPYGWAEFLGSDILLQLKEKYGDAAYNRGLAVKRLIARQHSEPIATQLKEVNRFYNQFSYVEDKTLWGQKDYWATPFEFIGKNGGDCEDYVISKYIALRSMGVPDDKLYLTYVKAVKQNVAHMVLSYFETPESIPLVLDNYNPRILSADKRTDLIPVYSFNAKSLFLAKSAGLGKALPTDKIKNSRWEQLLKDYERKKL